MLVMKSQCVLVPDQEVEVLGSLSLRCDPIDGKSHREQWRRSR